MNDDAFAVLPADARVKLDDYLDAVERALTDGGVARPRRRGIIDDIELHLREVIAATPAPHDAAAMTRIIARLDPPDSYVDAAGGAARADAPLTPAGLSPPRRRRVGRASAGCSFRSRA